MVPFWPGPIFSTIGASSFLCKEIDFELIAKNVCDNVSVVEDARILDSIIEWEIFYVPCTM